MLDQISGISFPHLKKKAFQYTFANNSFLKYSPQIRVSSIRILSVGTLIHPSLFGSNWKWRGTSTTKLLCLSKHSQLPRDLCKNVTVHYQTCPCVDW